MLPRGLAAARRRCATGELGSGGRTRRRRLWPLERERVEALERENRQLRQANEILRKVKAAALEWVHRFNHHRLLDPIGYLPPVEYEQAHYQQQGQVAA